MSRSFLRSLNTRFIRDSPPEPLQFSLSGKQQDNINHSGALHGRRAYLMHSGDLKKIRYAKVANVEQLMTWDPTDQYILFSGAIAELYRTFPAVPIGLAKLSL